MKIQKTMLAAAIALASLAAQASTTIGGYTFADNAFADSLVASSGTFTIVGTVPGVENNLVDNNPFTGVYDRSDASSSLTLQFTKTSMVNGAGADLVLFDLGTNDRFSLTINGVTLGNNDTKFLTTTVEQGIYDTNGKVIKDQLNAVAVDLSDFGIAQGAKVNTFTVGMNLGTLAPLPGDSKNQSVPTLSIVGALNTTTAPVPEPETYAMMLAGLGAIGAMVRRRKKA